MITATLNEPYKGWRNIEILKREGLTYQVEICGSGKILYPYFDEFILDDNISQEELDEMLIDL